LSKGFKELELFVPNFNINDSQGYKVGSIEQQSPGLIDAFEAFMVAKGAVRAGQVNEIVIYTESVHDMFNQTYAMLDSFKSLKSNIDVSQELSAMLSASESLMAASKAAPPLHKQKKYLTFFESTLKDECQKATETIQKVINSVQVLQELNRLFFMVDEYFEYHNASCDRLESEGFDLSDITDKKFHLLNDKWTRDTDVIIDYFNQIVETIENSNKNSRSNFPIEEFNELIDREQEMTDLMKACLVQTEGRENAAKRLLASTSHSGSPISVSAELQKLVDLKEEGHISEAEFKALKKKLM